MNKKIILLEGGISEERKVSLSSCKAIKNALEKLNRKYVVLDPADYLLGENKLDYNALARKVVQLKADIVFNGLHGGVGEDGTLQSLFELNNISFTGSGSNASFLSMNKLISKLLAQNCGIPIPDFKILDDVNNISEDSLIEDTQLPCVVKPVSSGSSVGITIVNSEDKIFPAVLEGFKYNEKVMLEQYIPGRELTVTILGEKALPVVEIKAKNGWYDYTHKYTEGKTQYICPAALDESESILLKHYAEVIYAELGCSDYARVDFRYDNENFYFLELNTLPGMTNLSLVPMAAKAEEISFSSLIRMIADQKYDF